jgi:uncharacterized protein YgbK (DUF1537 family)
VQFTKHGLSTSVVFGRATVFEKDGAGLLVHDTETRNKSTKIAYREVRDLCLLCRRTGRQLVYKKIDSTLRGNLGAEVKAVVDVFDKSSVVICSAYPEYSRTVVDGHLLVHGVPVDRTTFANDPMSPVTTSDVKALVSSQTTESVGRIQLRTVRKGASYVIEEIRQLAEKGIRILCADAENRNDLMNIAKACLETNVIPCGSAGLAEEIAARLPSVSSKIMVLSASTNEATLNELQRTAKYPRTFLIKARTAALVGRSRNKEIKRIRLLAAQAVLRYDVILICSAFYKRDFRHNLVSPKLNKLGESSDAIVRGLALATGTLALSRSVTGVLLTGGEMAAAFLYQIQARGLRLEREILPGISQGSVISGRAAGLKIVTKAGGFGFRGSMRKIVNCLTASV